MVTIGGLEKRKNRGKDEEINVMILQGDIVVAISKPTGKLYLTARKASVPFMFDEKACSASYWPVIARNN